MDITIGFFLVIIAGMMQGSFILPMTLVKNWKWENIWLVYSVLGMLALNLLLAYIFINGLQEAYMNVDSKDLVLLAIFGFGWGIGAVLFGIGMDKLGMSLGYPVIMGLIASIGGLLPLYVQHTGDILKPVGLTMTAGTLIVVAGIIVCSKAASQKTDSEENKTQKSNFSAGIIIAVAAGILSSLPNIGLSFGTGITEAAIASGTSETLAGNAVWAMFFSVGLIPNLIYTGFLIAKNKNVKAFVRESPMRNYLLGFLMAIMWIGSFYLYGISAVKLGSWGNIVGWPLFISISIVVGNLWGLWRGEWKDSNKAARKKLNLGLLVLIIAMVVIGLSNIL